jgi:hypothetical protein
MDDGQKTVNTEETPNSQNMVEIEQSELDALIDKGFSKGANRAKAELLESLGFESVDELSAIVQAKREADEANKSELEKSQDLINSLQKQVDDLNNQNKSMSESYRLKDLAMQNGINDAEYFKYLLDSTEKSEDFEEQAFIDSLKETKPYLFNTGSANNAPPKVDTTSNAKALDINQRIKGAKTMAELQKIQKELGV